MTLYELADTFFRFSTIVCFLLMAAFIMRDVRQVLSARMAVFCALSMTAYLIVSIPGIGEALGYALVPLQMVCTVSAVAAWLFCLSLFNDQFKLEPLHYAVAGIFAVLCLALYFEYYAYYGHWPLMSYTDFSSEIRSLTTIAFVCGFALYAFKAAMAFHLLSVAWSGRHEDLVEKRRRFRFVFVMMVSLIFLTMIVTESWLVRSHKDLVDMSHMLQLMGTLGVTVYFIWHMFRMNGDWMFGAASIQHSVALASVKGADRQNLLVLEKLVKEGTLLEQGLTISSLAVAAKMPEHRLRRLINQHLGFRNFSDYLNYHRVEAAKNRLAVVDDRHTPILTVAMDLGYNSLGPFNRAFKERLGITPTEFRKRALET